ncbi:unnamed protein product [Thelazia callipaeda]|uniref:CHHC U11-48K-type domain-containing protein n=1 Tax=Thelazia callipaeda TaxID=103827 RepID=A0A0N5CYB2_THECL|nr:unnamed protein product [Thelazia callipaeda]
MKEKEKSDEEMVITLGSTTVDCPYSKNCDHTCPVSDIFTHLARCRRSYYKSLGLEMELERCKYDGCHYVPKPEMIWHELTCHGQPLYNYSKKTMQSAPVSIHSPMNFC